MANFIRLKQIESGSQLNVAAGVGADFSASVNSIVSQSIQTTFSQSIVDIVTNNVGAVLPDGVISSSVQVVLQQTSGNLTGSRVIGGTAASSVNYENIVGLPTLISGSSQIVSILEPLNSFTSSLDNTFTTDAELAVTTSNLNIDMGEF